MNSDDQHNSVEWHLCWVSILLAVTNRPIKLIAIVLNVVVLSVIMLSVVMSRT
jgi:hypothetical protein